MVTGPTDVVGPKVTKVRGYVVTQCKDVAGSLKCAAYSLTENI
jgi:hypothetical protein